MALVVQWLGGWTRGLKGRAFKSNLGQVVHTHVPVSPSSIIWRRSRAVVPCGWESDRINYVPRTSVVYTGLRHK